MDSFIFPAIGMAAVMMIMTRRLEKGPAPPCAADVLPTGETGPHAKKDDWPAFAKLSAFVFTRATVAYGMTTFIPLYWVGVLKQTQAAGSMALALYAFVASCSTLLGGWLADRFGFNTIMRISATTFAPLVFIFTLTQYPLFSIIILALLGLSVNLCFSTLVTTGQAFLPNHIGFASGITMGMGVSMGGLAAPVLGRVGDLYGLTAAFHVMAAIACLIAVLSFFVPRHTP